MSKKIHFGLFFSFAFFSLSAIASFGQAPQGINYQAIARDASGNPLVSTSINVEFKIHKTSATGAVVYDENYNSTATNTFGLFTLLIGKGAPASGNFSTIIWGSNAFYLEVLINGTSMGTTQ
ncbi:MAG TPA: hypothetical protein VII99_03530, partial [Bacteroidia bacterium]